MILNIKTMHLIYNFKADKVAYNSYMGRRNIQYTAKCVRHSI